ncbi:leucine-rich repeat-containing protein 42 [Rhineura floridana]|uniref:leucine-rich repeat-containing protein 42 n=1 Tax=Rhineura floridana TaxID=261503 RepID=UPI002AC8804B|nr:leucine-rich repeat-containing protein 42 [Rhineura floridana]XP_061489028.1 leucine-rich repeat-containing protein 42 [Rhineura floridana]XP_061489029.1 leucine-rich repeat-containing protein 42 [Rhineura floridana]XP_061489030.1 leucine-rich repeat-containing protein 42 [Rhineura floridana]XP_061489031.1 leucine-rich repeat-containing protein 42 [Rhineura floridana]XP_061489032.1 leucine-rich repeat-containing protein 42 [Rhineura floridana]
MSYYLHAENFPDRASVYVRQNGQLYKINQVSGRVNNSVSRPSRLFSKGFSVELCVNRENDNGRTDHFIFTYTKKGNLRYSAKSLFSLVLSYIADNINHVDSLVDFPEQIAEKLFYAADARQKFTEPRTGLCALQKFTDAYGSLVLQTLCLKNGYLVISEKLEEIKSFRDLTCLDLSFCKLGDEHELLEHITNKTLSSLTRLLLKDNCLSDVGLRKMTAPVRVMKRGLENLSVLDLSCNPGITNSGLGYLLSFKKLNYLDLSRTGLQDINVAVCRIQTQIGLAHSEVPLKEFDHNSCKTEGWAEQTILQWKHTMQEAIQPEKTLKSRAAAQCFYGKRARTEEPLEFLVEESEPSENLQFYKPRAEMLSFPLLTGKSEVSEELQNKKSGVAEHKEQNFKSKQLSFSMADWDLLNSY